MAGATEPCATRTYRVVACRVVAVLTVGAGAWLPFAKAASWGTTPVPPPPVQQPLPSQAIDCLQSERESKVFSVVAMPIPIA